MFTRRYISWIKSAATSLLASLFLLLLIEGVLRLFWPQTFEVKFLNRVEWGKHDAELGHVNMPNALVQETTPEFVVRYETNAQGFRAKAPTPFEKPKGQKRILILGDSFTFGGAATYQDHWIEQLRNQLPPNVELINAGVSGYDTTIEALYLERLYPQFKPDEVWVVFVPNDLFTNVPIVYGKMQQVLAKGVLEGSSKVAQFHTLTAFKRLLLQSDFFYKMIYESTDRGNYFSSSITPSNKENFAIADGLVERIVQYTHVKNVPLRFISLPQQIQVIDQETKPSFDAHFIDKHFSRLTHSLGVDWFSLLPTFQKSYRESTHDLFYRLDGHFTPEGNALVAQKLRSKFF